MKVKPQTLSKASPALYHEAMALPLSPSTPLLEIAGLHLWFGEKEVVRGVDFELRAGETLGLVGESGSGKSVTSLAVLGLLEPAARMQGSIRWQGRDLAGASQAEMRALRGREMAMVFQEPMTALNPVMRIGNQIAEAIAAHQPRLSRRELKARTIAALEEVAIPEASRRYGDYPHQFSGGQRQRILIAMALVHRPRLLIADEPTTALDVTVQAQVLELLRRLRKEHNLAMIFTSHDLAVVGQVADRVAVMRQGVIVETGPAQLLLRTPQHEYTKSLLAAAPTLRTDRSQPLAIAR
ncbi:MAG TPA: ABC transporter ATP-binding protein [Acidobacteriaceae bacterium]|nr:ABC transporter ATP-binding protein [Acidobacteriaceae bacterium]